MNVQKRQRYFIHAGQRPKTHISSLLTHLSITFAAMPAFDDVYQQHQDLVYNLCLHYLQNKEEAEEATQDIFVKIYRKMPEFRGESSLKTWIYRIAIHHCLDLLKARKAQKRFGFMALFRTSPPLSHDPPDFNHPGVLLENKEELEQLFGKINQLPPQQKTALVLKYLDDLPQREIADIMGISEKAVESLLQRAKQTLKKG
jgi:RNA polymerase sigma factor (sigma-70 family)